MVEELSYGDFMQLLELICQMNPMALLFRYNILAPISIDMFQEYRRVVRPNCSYMKFFQYILDHQHKALHADVLIDTNISTLYSILIQHRTQRLFPFAEIDEKYTDDLTQMGYQNTIYSAYTHRQAHEPIDYKTIAEDMPAYGLAIIQSISCDEASSLDFVWKPLTIANEMGKDNEQKLNLIIYRLSLRFVEVFNVLINEFNETLDNIKSKHQIRLTQQSTIEPDKRRDVYRAFCTELWCEIDDDTKFASKAADAVLNEYIVNAVITRGMAATVIEHHRSALMNDAMVYRGLNQYINECGKFESLRVAEVNYLYVASTAHTKKQIELESFSQHVDYVIRYYWSLAAICASPKLVFFRVKKFEFYSH